MSKFLKNVTLKRIHTLESTRANLKRAIDSGAVPRGIYAYTTQQTNRDGVVGKKLFHYVTLSGQRIVTDKPSMRRKRCERSGG